MFANFLHLFVTELSGISEVGYHALKYECQL